MATSNIVVQEVNLKLTPNELDIISNALWESCDQHEEHIHCFGKFKSIKIDDKYVSDKVDKDETDSLDRENYITYLRLCKQIHRVNRGVNKWMY